MKTETQSLVCHHRNGTFTTTDAVITVVLVHVCNPLLRQPAMPPPFLLRPIDPRCEPGRLTAGSAWFTLQALNQSTVAPAHDRAVHSQQRESIPAVNDRSVATDIAETEGECCAVESG